MSKSLPTPDAQAARAETRLKNLRLALVLASVAGAFFVGFVVKIVLLSRP